jgi:methyl-accepting chemotaxis protein
MDEIGRITRIIRDIADQTGLLALNAAIEAARAGDAGRGFSVVAEEVKSLALMTQGSADEIAEIINALQTGTSEASQAMGKGIAEVKAGSVILDNTINTFSQISRLIEQINQDISQVTGVSEEQAAAVEEITASVHDFEGFIQKTAGESESLSEGSAQTASATAKISETINEININITQVRNDLNRFST